MASSSGGVRHPSKPVRLRAVSGDAPCNSPRPSLVSKQSSAAATPTAAERAQSCYHRRRSHTLPHQDYGCSPPAITRGSGTLCFLWTTVAAAGSLLFRADSLFEFIPPSKRRFFSGSPDVEIKDKIRPRPTPPPQGAPTVGERTSRPRIAAFKSALESPERPLSNAAKSAAVAVQWPALEPVASRSKGGSQLPRSVQPAPGGRSWGGAGRWKAGDAGSTGKIRVSRCDDGAGGFGSPKVGPPAASGRGGSAHTRPTR